MPFNFWLVHTPPGGHIDGISGECDLNREKSSGSMCPYGQLVLHSPLQLIIRFKQLWKDIC